MGCKQSRCLEGIFGGGDEDTAAARDEIAAERAQLAGFEDDAITGRITRESFARIAAGIEVGIAKLEQRASAGPGPALWGLLSASRDLADVQERRIYVLRAWGKMLVTGQRSALRAVLAAEPGCYFRLRPSGPDGHAHGTAVLDPRRVEARLPGMKRGWPPAAD